MSSTSGHMQKKGTEVIRKKDGLFFSILRSDVGRGVGV